MGPFTRFLKINFTDEYPAILHRIDPVNSFTGE